MKDQKQEYSFSDTAKSDLQVKTFKEIIPHKRKIRLVKSLLPLKDGNICQSIFLLDHQL